MLENGLEKFFSNRNDVYVNKHDVEFSRSAGGVIVSCCLPGATTLKLDISVELVTESKNIQELKKLFDLRLPQKFEDVTPATLHAFFKNGMADVYCTIDGYIENCLVFKNVNGKLISFDEEDEKTKHEVTVKLATPEDFQDYTISYFEKFINN